MRKKRRPVLKVIGGILSAILLGILIVVFPPTYTFTIGILEISILFPAMLLLLSSMMLFSLYFFKTIKHGVLVSSLIIIYLIFRLNSLTSPLFPILLLALFIALELLFVSPRKIEETKE